MLLLKTLNGNSGNLRYYWLIFVRWVVKKIVYFLQAANNKRANNKGSSPSDKNSSCFFFKIKHGHLSLFLYRSNSMNNK